MELHQLHSVPGSRRPRKRRGRGPGSGLGKTAGRGQKGQKSRSGYKRKPGFEGGQMPLKRRLPKVGFTSPRPRRFAVVNISQLNVFPDGSEVTPEVLLEKRVIRRLKTGVKILGEGSLDKKLFVWAHRFSQKAKETIEAAGGSCQCITSRKMK